MESRPAPGSRLQHCFLLVQADEFWQRGHVGVAPRLLIGPDAHPP